MTLDETVKMLKQAFEIEKKWGILGSDDLDDFIPPRICPTCKQSTQDVATHLHVKNESKNTLAASNEKIQTVLQMLVASKEKVDLIQSRVESFSEEKKRVMDELEQLEAAWNVDMSKIESVIQSARAQYAELSSSLSNDMKKLEYQNNLKQIEATAKADLNLYKNRFELAKQVSDTTKSELDLMKKNVEELSTKREIKRTESSTMSKVAEYFGARGVQTYVLQNAVLALQLVTQSYLDELSDGSLRLQLQLDDGDRILRTVSVLGVDGDWIDRPLSSLSG